MTLRGKLLLMFAVLAVVPLLAMGVLGYVQSARAVEAQIAAQTRLIAERSAAEIQRRVADIEAELLLVAENAETQRLLRARRQRAPELVAQAAAEQFIESMWPELARRFTQVEIRDAGGRSVLRFAQSDSELPGGSGERTLAFDLPATDWENGDQLGTVNARVRAASLLPPDVLENRFGTSGITAVVGADGVLVHFTGGTESTPAGADALIPREAREVRGAAGVVRYVRRDSARVGWISRLARPSLTVFSSSSVAEFAGPFDRMRTLQLAVVLAVVLAVTLAFVLLLRRATRSLEELTQAADRVGGGDFDPVLPPAGSDEVGRLTRSFQLMITRIREMMTQIERNRQLAAIGEFAAELSHEIRNPLTSVKLNLQRIERATDSGRAPEELRKPVGLALREIRRLERVVRGVLQLGRPQKIERSEIDVRELLTRAVELVRPQADERGVVVSCDQHLHDAVVLADPEQLEAAILNLLLNAIEAMPAGGELNVRLTPDHSNDRIAVSIQDTGSGIPAEAREQLFRPFYTTKKDGTGLGLVLAMRTIEAHGGALELVRSDASGTEFRLTLPIAAGVPA